MIVRIWRGWAANSATADLYEEFLRSTFLPSIHSIKGYHGASVLRRTIAAGEVEFTTLTRFESLEAVRAFAGEDYEACHVAPRARELLPRFEARCQHFDASSRTVHRGSEVGVDGLAEWYHPISAATLRCSDGVAAPTTTHGR